MNKHSIAILACSLASFACRKTTPDLAIEDVIELREKMCACKDKACADRVSEALNKWISEDKAEGKPRVSEDDDKKIAAVTEELTNCMTKLMTAPAGDKKK